MINILILSICFVFSAFNVFAATSITQYGVTWTFSADCVSGQFINGDYYVVTPCTITDIQNTWHAADPATVDYDGTTVDSPRDGVIGYPTQGFHNSLASYSSAANVSHNLPYTAIANTSIITSVSHQSGDSDLPTSWTDRPALKRIAILTVLSSAPPVGSFRPSYAVGQKTLYNTSSINYSKLPDLTLTGSESSLATYESWVQGPWISWNRWASGEFFRPSLNYPYYGANYNGTYNRYVAAAYGAAVLATLVDIGDKTTLVNNLVQIGIDYYGLYQNGATWPADGGHLQGHKLPILFTGYMLNNAGMLSIGSAALDTFQDDNHWYIATADLSITRCGDKNGCPAPCGDGGTEPTTDIADRQYYAEDVGKAEWGIRHHQDTCRDDARLIAGYRQTNYDSVGGHALAALILGLEDEWNNQAYFDYHDRMFGVPGSSAGELGGPDMWGTPGAFAENMWTTYRSSCAAGACLPSGRVFQSSGLGRVFQSPGAGSVVQ